MPETPTGKAFQESHEHYEHSQPQTSLGEGIFSEEVTPAAQSWTKSVFAAVKEREVELEFPYLGCEVIKVMDGERKRGWVGYIREIDGDSVQVWWDNHWQTNRSGKPIKDVDGLPSEKWARCKLSEIRPRPLDEAQQAKRHPDYEARNQKYLDQARRKQQHSQGTTIAQPYHPKTNPPKKGDRVRQNCGTIKLGQVTDTRSKNPRYQITWDDGQPVDLTFELIEDLDIRRVD